MSKYTELLEAWDLLWDGITRNDEYKGYSIEDGIHKIKNVFKGKRG